MSSDIAPLPMENQQVSDGAAPAEAAGAWLDKNSESYERVINAMRRGLVADGPVTLIFERRRRADRRVEATATAETNTS